MIAVLTHHHHLTQSGFVHQLRRKHRRQHETKRPRTAEELEHLRRLRAVFFVAKIAVQQQQISTRNTVATRFGTVMVVFQTHHHIRGVRVRIVVRIVDVIPEQAVLGLLQFACPSQHGHIATNQIIVQQSANEEGVIVEKTVYWRGPEDGCK